MNVVVIGGGASGVVTVHLLRGVHHTTLVEREPMLGGNIRTLGRNVSCPALDPGVYIDAGVIEFKRDNFPAFHVLMDELGVQLGEAPGTTGLFLGDGHSYKSPRGIARSTHNPLVRIRERARLLRLAPARVRFMRRTSAATPEELRTQPLSHYLDDGDFSLWVRLLVMYAYSIPAASVGHAPAALAVPMLRDFLRAGRWSRIKGGVYKYIERILEGFDGKVLLETHVARVRRDRKGVELEMISGEKMRFDAIVFATTPDQVLALLADPSAAEVRRFGAWKAQAATTLVHTDDGIFERHAIGYPSEFDLIETGQGNYGYNAYLNRLTGLSDDVPHYQLAFNLAEEIDPAQVLHTQHHATPRYTVEALRYRDEVIETNGENHTFHAGAYLGDGLHEGAFRSANAVSRLLGGHVIRY
ncbi:MAG: FAD-dependent oxidoreductase [Myxococcales bacterium]|nr:FAD-dependent oxidoreductase [Myxococcales bacterium]